jgi:FkbM family methyltransferase
MNYGIAGDVKESGEFFLLDYTKNLLRKNPVIFDVGANIGKYSLLVNEVFEKRVKIYAFEPSRKIFRSLEKSTKMFSNIKSFQIGIGEVEKAATLYYDKEKSALASIHKRKLDHLGIDFNRKEEVTIVSLDNFCQENKIERINLLKLDIEGNEINALRGASRLLKNNCIDFIQFEFGGCNIDSRTYIRDFFDLLGNYYSINRIIKNGIVPLGKYKETYEIFTTANYLAVKKRKN